MVTACTFNLFALLGFFCAAREQSEVGKKSTPKQNMEAAVVPLMFTINYLLSKQDDVDMDKVIGGMIMTVIVACLGAVSPRLAYTTVLCLPACTCSVPCTRLRVSDTSERMACTPPGCTVS